jgi:hypothetical protein
MEFKKKELDVEQYELDVERVEQVYHGLMRPLHPWPEDIRGALEILDRYRVKQPYWEGSAWRCPTCKCRVRNTDKHRDGYCTNCGQRLWAERLRRKNAEL